VFAATDRLLVVEEMLRSPRPVYARGVALLEGLLSEGDSSLYAQRHRGGPGQRLDVILGALTGGEPG